MSTKYSLIWVVFLFLGCAQNRVGADPDLSHVDHRPAIIVVPGYYGSALRNVKTKSRAFITVSDAIFGSEPLSLYQDELKTPPGPQVEVEGIMRSVTIVPGLYALDVYGDLLDHLAKDKNVQVISFSYDWRQDLAETAGKLSTLIRSLKASGVPRIDIVAHSMGGLVTGYYLGYGDQPLETAILDWRGAREVNRVAFFGTPFRGVFSVFRNMTTGAVLSGNRSLFPYETVASYPACFQLIGYQSAHLTDRQGHHLPLDLSDPNLWKSDEVGLYRRKDLPTDVLDKRYKFMSEQIARANLFAKKLRMEHDSTNPPPAGLQVFNVVGVGRKVIDSAFPSEPVKGQTHFVFDTDEPKADQFNVELLFTPGDGTVSQSSAQIPEGLVSVTKSMTSTYIHESIFKDPAVQSSYDQFFALKLD